MLEQKLRNRQPGALGGVGLVLLVVLAVIAGSAFPAADAAAVMLRCIVKGWNSIGQSFT